MKLNMTVKLFLICFTVCAVFFFRSNTAQAFCGSNSDCSCSQQCSLFNCIDSAGGPGQTCDFGTGQGCVTGYYFTNSGHNFTEVPGTCGYINPGNACPGSVSQPYVLGCSYSCGGSCETPFYHNGYDSCGNGNYCSEDYGCNCRQWCDSLPNNLQPYCALTGHACSSGYEVATYASCGDGSGGNCCVLKPLCTNGTTSCSAPGVCQNAPTNTCYNGNGTANRTCYHNTLSNGSTNCRASAFNSPVSCTTDNCNAGGGYACTSGNCTTSITAHIYIDYGHDGGNDSNYPYGVVTINGGSATTTGSDGTVTFSGLRSGNTYAIAYSDNSADFQSTGATSQNITLNNNNGNQTVIFRVTPLYTISGNVFNDKNKDTKYNGTDSLYTGSSTIHITGGPTTIANITQTDGTYTTGQTLESGTYNVSQTHALNNGYNYTTASTWAVTVGNPAGNPKCNVNTSPDASCSNPNAGSITNLNFGVTNENPWQQSVCYDVRDDSGTYTDQIPAAPNCGGVSGAYNSVTNADCTTGAGIIFTCDATPDFGLGSANANAWQAGGTGQQQECFTGAGLNVVRTSYDYLLTTARESGITPTDLSSICTVNNCTLPSTLSKGIYIAHSDVSLNAYSFPVNPSVPQGFIFLIDGNLTIKGNIIVPAGSVAAFSTSGNIIVDKTVGNTVTDPNNPEVNNPNIEGLYSADADFIIQSNGSVSNYCNADGTPKDKKLNIVGSVVTNAAQKGGSFVNNRDLCIYDLSCGSVTFGDGNPDGNGTSDEGLSLSYILTLFGDGKFLNHKLFNWEEIKP